MEDPLHTTFRCLVNDQWNSMVIPLYYRIGKYVSIQSRKLRIDLANDSCDMHFFNCKYYLRDFLGMPHR